MKSIIFLDVDGVLNDYQRSFGLPRSPSRHCITAMQSIINRTRAAIVLTTSWRYWILRGEMTPAGFARLLATHGLQADVIDVTAADEACSDCGHTDPIVHAWRNGSHVCPACRIAGSRGKQITAWLAKNGKPDAYLAIDDQDDGITAAGHPLLRTIMNDGLTQDHVEIACSMLIPQLRLSPC